MTYEELVKEVKKNYGALDASNIKEHVAVQFNIEGEAEGAFYVEIADSNVDVEPFEYYDRDAVVTTSADIALSLSSKKVSLKDAYNDETAKVWGDLDKILYAFEQLKAKEESLQQRRQLLLLRKQQQSLQQRRPHLQQRKQQQRKQLPKRQLLLRLKQQRKLLLPKRLKKKRH